MKEFILELKKGNKVIQSWNLERNKKYILGRSADADITIEEKTLSRKHAQITVMAGGSATIQDLESANGTFIDGKQTNANQMVLLRKGTQIVLAEMQTILFVNGIHSREQVDLSILEKIIESEEEDDDTEERKPVTSTKNNEAEKKKGKNQSPKKKREESSDEKPRRNDKSRSKSPKRRPKDGSRSRSRSNEKEARRFGEFNPKSAKPTIKLPVKAQKQKLALESANNKSPEKSNKLQDLGLEDEETNKFMKLMGIKNPEKIALDDAKVLPGLKYLKSDMKDFNKKNEKMNDDLEGQFSKGIMRRGAGKGGLGFQ